MTDTFSRQVEDLTQRVVSPWVEKLTEFYRDREGLACRAYDLTPMREALCEALTVRYQSALKQGLALFKPGEDPSAESWIRALLPGFRPAHAGLLQQNGWKQEDLVRFITRSGRVPVAIVEELSTKSPLSLEIFGATVPDFVIASTLGNRLRGETLHESEPLTSSKTDNLDSLLTQSYVRVPFSPRIRLRLPLAFTVYAPHQVARSVAIQKLSYEALIARVWRCPGESVNRRRGAQGPEGGSDNAYLSRPGDLAFWTEAALGVCWTLQEFGIVVDAFFERGHLANTTACISGPLSQGAVIRTQKEGAPWVERIALPPAGSQAAKLFPAAVFAHGFSILGKTADNPAETHGR